MNGKQGNRLDIHKARSHLNELACNVHVAFLHLPDIVDILLHKFKNRNVVNIQFVLADEVKQKVKRAFKHLKLIINLFHFLTHMQTENKTRKLYKQTHCVCCGKRYGRIESAEKHQRQHRINNIAFIFHERIVIPVRKNSR